MMQDKYLCVMGLCVVIAYGIYMFFNPHTDGIVFGSVMAVIGALAGVHITQRYGGPSEVYVDDVEERISTADQEQ